MMLTKSLAFEKGAPKVVRKLAFERMAKKPEEKEVRKLRA